MREKFTHETCIRKHPSKINKKIWKHLHQSLSKLHRWFQLLSKHHTLLLELMILKTNWNWQENNMGWKLNWFLAHSGEEKFSHRQLFSAIKLVDSPHIIFAYYTDVWRTFLLSCWSFCLQCEWTIVYIRSVVAVGIILTSELSKHQNVAAVSHYQLLCLPKAGQEREVLFRCSKPYLMIVC